jgi:ubiquinone/menaquinone biosynthesis C-methylase UbiE
MNPTANIAVSGMVIASATTAAALLIRQCRKPRGWIGQGFAHVMNRSHRGLSRWGLGDLAIPPGSAILDVGCGGGKTIQELARAVPDGTVAGVDYSTASVAVARRANADAIRAGRVTIHHAPVAELPFAANSFDLVTAIESHYYWPDFVSALREIHRVLRPGGKVVLIAESYQRTGRQIADRGAMRLLGGRLRSVGEHTAALLEASFSALAVKEDSRHGWLCVTGVKPD